MSAIARLKIVLKDVEPFVMRQVEVPLNLKLDRLHTVIQTAMGWSDSHLYEFRFAGDVAFGIPDPDHLSNTIDARREPLRGALEDWGGKTFHYYYDFGDYWHHVIKIEKVVPALSNFDYPFFLTGTGRCPPEDVGGVPGYAEYLAALADPNYPDRDEYLRYRSEDFDPDKLDTVAIALAIDNLSRNWTPKPRRKSSAATKH